MSEEINIFIAFGAGVLSFISPCVLPLYPAFLSYITGMSLNEIKDENKMLNRKSLLHTLFFCLVFQRSSSCLVSGLRSYLNFWMQTGI